MSLENGFGSSQVQIEFEKLAESFNVQYSKLRELFPKIDPVLRIVDDQISIGFIIFHSSR